MRVDNKLAKWPSLSRRIEPRPGGLRRLRAAIDADGRGRRSRIWFAVPIVAAGAALLFLWWQSSGAEHRDTRDPTMALIAPAGGTPHPEAVVLGLAQPPRAALADPRVQSGGDADVVFAWVAPVQGGATAPKWSALGAAANRQVAAAAEPPMVGR